MRFALVMCSCILWSTLLSQDKPLVVASASMIRDIALNIGGDRFTYGMIVPIGGDPHIYEPTPSDAQLCGRADLILQNGLTFEGWIAKLIRNSGSQGTVVTVTEGVEPIASTVYANATDPHAWMDATNGIIYARNIASAMSNLIPADSAFFRENFESYREKLHQLDTYIMQKIREIPERKRILITSHDAFHYYGKRYGLRLESILGTSTDVDVQTADIRRLNEVIRSSDVPAVFVESTINPRMLEQIASDNQIGVGGKLFADSLGDTDSPASTYIGMLKYNTDTIHAALTQSRGGQSTETADRGSSIWLWMLILAPVVLLAGYFLIRVMRKS